MWRRIHIKRLQYRQTEKEIDNLKCTHTIIDRLNTWERFACLLGGKKYGQHHSISRLVNSCSLFIVDMQTYAWTLKQLKLKENCSLLFLHMFAVWCYRHCGRWRTFCCCCYCCCCRCLFDIYIYMYISVARCACIVLSILSHFVWWSHIGHQFLFKLCQWTTCFANIPSQCLKK